MIDFERLVEELLLCETTISSETSTSPVVGVYTAIDAEFSSTPSLPTDAPFYNTVQNNIFTRSSAYSLAEDDMIPHYPYIDYLCFINEQVKTGSDNIKLDKDKWANHKRVADGADIGIMTDEWVLHFKGPGTVPARAKTVTAVRHPILDYIPQSQTLLGLRPKLIEILLAKGVLGNLAMKNYVTNNYNLAEALNSAVSLGQTNIPFINRKQEDKNLNYILLNPQLYVLGSPGKLAPVAPPTISTMRRPGPGLMSSIKKGVSDIAAPLTQPKQLPEKYKNRSESIFAIAQSIPGYSTSKSVSAANILKFEVSAVQSDATSITEAKLIIKQLEAMSNTLPGKKDWAGKIDIATKGANDAMLGTKLAGT